MILRAVAAMALLAFSGCAASEKYATYIYNGIDLGTAVSGTISSATGCIVIASELGPLTAVLPRGTMVDEQRVMLPAANGSDAAVFGEAYRLEGGFSDALVAARSEGNCPARRFIVNHIRSLP